MEDFIGKSSPNDLARGWFYDSKSSEYVCIVCGEAIKKGIITKQDDEYYDAKLSIERHIELKHDGMFNFLVKLDGRVNGLTGSRQKMMTYFHKSFSNKEIAKLEGINESTVRNYRFRFRVEEKKSRIFLALMELMSNKEIKDEKLSPPHTKATEVDLRYAASTKEEQEIINKYLPDGMDGPLTTFRMKEKRRLVILKVIAQKFEPNRKYTEKEINAVLRDYNEEYVMIRRYLIDYGFLDRKIDGSEYWVKV